MKNCRNISAYRRRTIAANAVLRCRGIVSLHDEAVWEMIRTKQRLVHTRYIRRFLSVWLPALTKRGVRDISMYIHDLNNVGMLEFTSFRDKLLDDLFDHRMMEWDQERSK